MEELGSLNREYLRGLTMQDTERLSIVGGDSTSTSQRQRANRRFAVVKVGRKMDKLGRILIRRKVKKG